MKYKSFLIIIFWLVISCDRKNSENFDLKSKAKVNSKILIEKSSDFEKFVNQIPLTSMPFKDLTNFDNVDKLKDLSDRNISILKINYLVQEMNSVKFNKRFFLSKNFETLSVTYKKGDSELFTDLINYSHGGKILDRLGISYDEIAESMLRKESLLDNKTIKVYTINSFFEPEKTDIEEYLINSEGKFEIIK